MCTKFNNSTMSYISLRQISLTHSNFSIIQIAKDNTIVIVVLDVKSQLPLIYTST